MTSAVLDHAVTTGALVASHHRPWGDGGWSPWFPLIPLLFIGIWVVIAAFVVRRRWRPMPARSGESVLAERFARGEIDEAEYRERQAVLRRER